MRERWRESVRESWRECKIERDRVRVRERNGHEGGEKIEIVGSVCK